VVEGTWNLSSDTIPPLPYTFMGLGFLSYASDGVWKLKGGRVISSE
jgi:hypothetical protein